MRAFALVLLMGCAGASPLRVGTTGDYAPFTVWPEDAAEPSGRDIDAARAFAAAEGVPIQWVRTSWPRLMDDLAAGRFDVAWGGITVTDARRKVASFSRPYAQGGKQLLTRCEAPVTAESLGRATFLVNPGGTNETYLRRHHREATVILEPDNLAIFARIARGDADAMITDSFEAELQARRYEELCVGLDGALLTRFDLAVMGPKDSGWLRRVDRWLARRRDHRVDYSASRNHSMGGERFGEDNSNLRNELERAAIRQWRLFR